MLPAAIQQAVRKLVQFQRVELAPGRSADLTRHVAPHDLPSWYYDTDWTLHQVTGDASCRIRGMPFVAGVKGGHRDRRK